MSGIVIRYQGFDCVSVTFRRKRGYAADTTTVIIPVDNFPNPRFLRLPRNAGAIGNIEAQNVGPDPENVLRVEQAIEGQPLPQGLNFEGTLLIQGLRPDGSRYKREVNRLFVLRIDTEQRPDGEGVEFVKLTLVDERFFWSRGIVSKWSFGRLRANGEPAKDSLNPNGRPPSREQILREVVAPGLFRSPSVSNVPEDWARTIDTQFQPFDSAIKALSRLVTVTGAEDPCLRDDSSLAIHARGEGKVAYANSPGAGNDTPIPPEVFLDEGGRGQGFSQEAGYPEDYVLVVGRPRVASIALDDWEPVIMVRGQPFLLSEELVTKLTGSERFGLRWLRKWLMFPPSLQGRVDIPEDVQRILREQAYRFFRLPGAEKVTEGFYNGQEGRNAHLLPLQDRAETVNGRRTAPSAEIYRFVTRHKSLRQGDAGTALYEGTRLLQAAQSFVRRQAISQGLGTNPFAVPPEPDNERFNSFRLILDSRLTGEDRTSFSTRLQQARVTERIKEDVGSEAGRRYEEALDRLAEAAGPVDAEIWELAKKLAKLEKEAAEQREAGFEGPSENIDRQIEEAITDSANKIAGIRQQEQDRTQAGVPTDGQDVTVAVALQNLPRTASPRTRVVSREQGVVQVFELAGHVADTDVPSQQMTELVPCPVRVIFGATLRPRLDVLPGEAGPTGSAEPSLDPLADQEEFDTSAQPRSKSCPGGQNLVADVLSDQESHYVAAFKRVARGRAEKVGLSQVPFNLAVRVSKQWAEMIPLATGVQPSDIGGLEAAPNALAAAPDQGNRLKLDAEAQKIAEEIFSKPSEVTAERRRLDGAWAIQCDGVVAGTEITTEFVDGYPAGFTTTVLVGSNPPEIQDGFITRPRRPSGELLRDSAAREAHGT